MTCVSLRKRGRSSPCFCHVGREALPAAGPLPATLPTTLPATLPVPGSPAAPSACNRTKASRAQGRPVAAQRLRSHQWHCHGAVWLWWRLCMAPRCCGSAAAMSGGKSGRRWLVLGGQTRGMWDIPGRAWGWAGFGPQQCGGCQQHGRGAKGTSKGQGPLCHPCPCPTLTQLSLFSAGGRHRVL